MVVLVNAGYHGFRNRFRAACKDYKRANLLSGFTNLWPKVGTKHHYVNCLPTPLMKLTTARYYTPNGRSIQAKGIVPDLMVDEYALIAIWHEWLRFERSDLPKAFVE
jgi:carboxyl-terminal processing protease